MWSAGHVIVRRDLWNGQPWYATAAVVVDDSAERLITFSPDGSEAAVPATAGIIQQLAAGSWTLAPTSRYNHTLGLYTAEASHTICLFWTPRWEFLGWYVNLEDPYRRTSLGVDTCDLALDIVVAPNFSWSWKDEGDFAQMVALGLISAERAAEIRADGEAVIEQIESQIDVFSEPWPNWRPDETWPVPALPAGWSGP